MIRISVFVVLSDEALPSHVPNAKVMYVYSQWLCIVISVECDRLKAYVDNHMVGQQD